MKAFIFDLFNRLRRTDDILDAKAVFCNKTWRAFTDTQEKEIHIFMEDGSLVISVDGVVSMGKWFYVPANQSLVLSGNNQNFLVHPVICNNVLALVQDGTENCSFLLDDTQAELSRVKSLQGLRTYIEQNYNKIPESIYDKKKQLLNNTQAELPKAVNNTLVDEITSPKGVTVANGQLTGSGFYSLNYTNSDLAHGNDNNDVLRRTYYFKGYPFTGKIRDLFDDWELHCYKGKPVGFILYWGKIDGMRWVAYECEILANRIYYSSLHAHYESNWSSFKYLVTKGPVHHHAKEEDVRQGLSNITPK